MFFAAIILYMKVIKLKHVWGCILSSFLLIFSLSCATSSGGTYSRSVHADEEAARRNRAAQEKNSGNSGSSSSGSASSGNSAWAASDPYASGWNTSNPVIIVKEVLPHGTVKLLGITFGTPVLIDGDPRIGNTFDLSPGTHHIEVRAFGFEVWERTVQITKDQTTVLSVELVPADFRIIDVEMQNSSVNPDNPGYFGSARLTVYVTAPGKVGIQVLDQDHRPVRSLGPYEIHKGSQDVFWDGTDGKGRVVPKGKYTVVVQGLDREAQPIGQEFRHYVYVGNDGIPLRTWLGGSGFSGPFFVPDAQVLPKRTWSFATAFVSHLASPAEPVGSTWVSFTSLRVAVSEYAEAGMLVTYVGRSQVSDVSTDWIGCTATAKLKLTEYQNPFSAAIGIRGAFRSFISDISSESTPYIPPAWDGLANYDGLSLSVPLEYSDGPLRLFAAPEIQVSTFYPYWTDDRWPTPDLFVWSTLRMGAEVRVSNPLRLALSAAMKSDPLNKGALTLQFPLSLGAELSIYTRGPLNITAYTLAEAGGPYSYVVYGGIGFGGRF